MTQTYDVELKNIKANSKLEAGLHAIRVLSKALNTNMSEGGEDTFITEVER